MDSQYSLGNSQYPQTVTESQQVISNHTWDKTYKDRKKEGKRDRKKDDKSSDKQEQDTIPKNLSFAQMRNKCYACGGPHKLNDCSKRNDIPRGQWYINNAKEVKQMKQFQQIVSEINEVDNASGTAASAATNTATESVASNQTPGEQFKNAFNWNMFNFFSAEGYNLAAQPDRAQALRDTMILDSGSSMDLFCNPSILQNIKPKKKIDSLTTNAGEIKVALEGTLPKFGQVPFHPEAVTNIMSLGTLTDKFPVYMASPIDNAFYVHTQENIVRFGRDQSNLYSFQPEQLKNQGNTAASMTKDARWSYANKQFLQSWFNGTEQDDIPPDIYGNTFTVQQKCFMYLQTVQENMLFYAPREIELAKKARELLISTGSPSIQDLKNALSMNAIRDCPVTTQAINHAEKIYGPDVGILRGKTVRRKPIPIVENLIELPKELYTKRDTLLMALDIMFVNEMPFLTTITYPLYYRTAQRLASRSAEQIYGTLDMVFRAYNGRNFKIKDIHCDLEFKKLFDPVEDELGVTMHYPPANGHVGRAERNNRTIKERVRCTYQRLPYKNLPTYMLTQLVQESARKLNFFPNKYGMSKVYSPRQILHGKPLDYEHVKYAFGQYVEGHLDLPKTKGPHGRTTPGIYIKPNDSDTGHEIWCLATEREIPRARVTPLPITPAVIRAIETTATAQKQKGLRIRTRRGEILFDSTWTAGVDYDSDDEDSDYNPDEEMDSVDEYDEDDYEEDEPPPLFTRTHYDSDSDSSDEEDEEESDRESHDEHAAEEILYDEEYPAGNAGVDTQSTGVEEQVQLETVDEEDEEGSVQSDEEQPAPLRESGIPPRRTGRFRQPPVTLQPTMTGQSHDLQQHLIIAEEDAHEYEADLASVAVNLLHTFKQKYDPIIPKTTKHSHVITYSLKKGIEKFQTRGYNAALKEMEQLHERDCWKPIRVSEMKPTEKKKALESLIFLVEKKSGKIKARHCANGSKQRQWMSQDQTASPTAMTESVLLTAAIEAEENRDVATFDIPNAFIQTPVEEQDDQGDRIVMKIKGAMIDMLLDIDQTYKDFITEEKGQRVLYVHILRAIYGMLMSGLLFYKKFRASIERIGYKINPYDPCVANKIIRGKQHTLTWHVDDVKGSHVDSKVNDEFGKWLQKEYGAVADVTTTRGKKHVYLGMLLDYSTPGEVKIDMTDYVKEMINEFPTTLDGNANTPANDHLFSVDKGSKLEPLKAEAFHTFVAKALFLTMRSRPDIRLTVAFLCTRVREPTSYDWMKLTRLMNFLQKTKEDSLVLRSDGTRKIEWSVDASFGVHADMKSHSGMSMTMGRGAILSMSRKQKINTRSSTEAELVAVDDSLSQILWTKNFLDEQDYKTAAHIILQDNESAIKLETQGHKSIGQRSRHINMKYFLIKDQVDRKQVQIEYRQTDEMDGDYQSKPLQGIKFRKFRNRIMNLQ